MGAAFHDCAANLGEVASLTDIEVKHDHDVLLVNVASIDLHVGLH